jgi:hypothetical protein
MYNKWDSNPELINCVFSGNSSAANGGGVYNYSSNPIFTNCTFSGNTANRCGGVYNSGSPTLTNCILWGNTDSSGLVESAQIAGGTPSATYSCIQDDDPSDGSVYTGQGNIDDDPLFVDANGLDGPTEYLPMMTMIMVMTLQRF